MKISTITLATILLTLSTSARLGAADTETFVAGGAFTGYGEASADTHTIKVSGDLAHPGTYHFAKGTKVFEVVRRLGERGATAGPLTIVFADGTKGSLDCASLTPDFPFPAEQIAEIIVGGAGESMASQ
jgi:hypothetical protein